VNAPLLEVRSLTKHYAEPDGRTIHAVDGVDLTLARGETLGLVGESGSGKSTLGRTIARLTEPTAGHIVLDGVDISHLSRRALRPFRHKLQMVFQDPFASLNPRLSVRRILDEPLIVQGRLGRAERRERIDQMIRRVGLRGDSADRYPYEFSGGQRQRIAIARALVLDPVVLVCDEPVSALDVSIRAQVINLFDDLRRKFGLAALFISHDLSVVEHVADRVAVMYLGKMVEMGSRQSFWMKPRHPYTQALISAVPVANPHMAHSRVRVRLTGDPPSPIDIPRGCRFNTRCPLVTERCRIEEPRLRQIGAAHAVACHLVE
jgi:oligopeptide transport system ATP-binding protein